jgi:hypothetical protein
VRRAFCYGRVEMEGLALHPLVAMKNSQEFAIRYYRWAVQDTRAEMEAGFPLISRLGTESAEFYLSLMSRLDSSDRDLLMSAFLKSYHQEAVSLLGEEITADEEDMLGWANRQRGEMFGALSPPRIRSRKLRSMLKSELQQRLSPPPESTMVGPKPKIYRFMSTVGPWVVQTWLDCRLWPNYSHFIYGKGRPLAGGLSIESWMGISGVTSWPNGPKSAAEIVTPMADAIERFIKAAPSLLEGLSPDTPQVRDQLRTPGSPGRDRAGDADRRRAAPDLGALKATHEFAVRYYRWAVQDTRAEMEAGFPLVSRLGEENAESYLSVINRLDRPDRYDLVAAFIKRFHPVATRLLNEEMTREEEKLLEWATDKRREMLGAPPRPRPRVSSRKLKSILENELQKRLSPPPELSNVGPKMFRFMSHFGPWVVQTWLDYGRRPQYFHHIDGEGTSLAKFVSIESWMGISGTTDWTIGPKSEMEIATTMVDAIERFFLAVPGLLEGLLPEDFKPWSDERTRR